MSSIEVGIKLPEVVTEPLSRATLALFAGASGDHNPIHIDTDFARAAGYDDVFAHGMLSVAFLAQVVTNWVPQDRIRSLSTRFLERTPVNARLRCCGHVEKISIVDGERRAQVALYVELEDGTKTIAGAAVVALS